MQKIAARFMIAAFCLVGTVPAVADTLLINKTLETPAIELPRRGISKDQVLAYFGEPDDQVPAIGDPPISRWVFPDFVVYFEYDTVLHSVFLIK
jgi:hypothetical protein